MLTDTKIKALKPSVLEYEVDDGKVAGLRLRVLPSGAKSWVYRYRVGGVRRRVSRRYPALGLAKARAWAMTVAATVEHGGDPAAVEQAEREALRMIDLYGVTDTTDKSKDTRPGWYLEHYVTSAGANGTAKAPRSIETDRLYIREHLRKRTALMRKRCSDVSLADLNRIKAACSPGAWRKVRSILRIGLRHAQSLGQLPPGLTAADKTTQTADKKCERFLDPAERKRLNDALARAERLGSKLRGVKWEKNKDGVLEPPRGGLSAGYVRLFRLLALTGMRLGEGLELQWSEIDFRHGVLRLPTSKTGAKTVPLTPQALAFLKAERGSVGRLGRVCGSADGGRLTNVPRAWASVIKSAKLPGLRIHDLRHSWASDAISAGVPLHVVGQVLGHKSPATTQRYAHLADRALREGLAIAGAAIEAANTSGQ